MGDINTAVGSNEIVAGNGVANQVGGVAAVLTQDVGSSHDGFNFAPGGDINTAIGQNELVLGNGVANQVGGVAAILDQDVGSSHTGFDFGATGDVNTADRTQRPAPGQRRGQPGRRRARRPRPGRRKLPRRVQLRTLLIPSNP